MKLFKKTILALMAVAVSAGFSACSDDDDYIAATNQDGAYFAADAAQSVGVARDAESFNIEVYRTDGSQHTYDLLVTDPKDMFEVPDKVVFNGQEHATTLTIGIKGELVDDTDYPLEIKIIDGSGIGLIDYKFNVRIAKTVITGTVGRGRYIYNGFLTGSQSGVPVTSWYLQEEPQYVEWTIGNPKNADEMLFDCYTLTLMFENFEPNEKGVYPFRIKDQFVYDNDGSMIWVTDVQTYYEMNGESGAQFKDDCYFDPESGLITLHTCYYIKDTDRWYGDDKFEYMQLDGYPDYSVTVEYKGLYIDPAQSTQAIGVFSTGNDVAKVAAAAVLTSDPGAALEAVLAGGDDIVEFEGGKEITQLFKTQGPGDYIIMAVTYDETGEAMELDYDKFTINEGLSDPNLGWTNIGQADFIDGWILPAFAYGDGTQVIAADFQYPVEVQQNDDIPSLFRLVEPYGDNYPLAEQNKYPSKRNIQFWIEPDIDFYAIEPQPSGFGTSNWGKELVIHDLMGMITAANPDVSHSVIVEFTHENYLEEAITTYEDGIVTINLPMHASTSTGELGFSWQSSQEGVIYMPEVPESVKAMDKAKRVAAPNFVGLRSTMRAERAVNTQKMRIAFPADFSKNAYARPTLRK